MIEQHAHARLDVARGLAALIVFLAHLGDAFFLRFVGPDHPVALALSFLARHAVLVFFLMSGNLITRSILLNIRRNGRFDGVEYVVARVVRIYPPFLGAIAVCVAVWLAIHGFDLPGSGVTYGLPGDLYRIRDSYVIDGADIIRALTMRGGLLQADGPLWSLYIEFQIYLVAMAVAALWRGDLLTRLFSCVLGLAALWLLRDQMFFAVVWTLGAATALWTPAPRLSFAALGLSVLIVLAAVFGRPALLEEGDQLAGQFFQLLCCVPYSIMLFYAQTRLQYSRMLVATGNFSYSLYVVHFPLLLLGLSLSQNWVGREIARSWIAAGLTGALTLAFVIPFAAIAEQQGRFKRLALGAIRGKKTRS